MIYINMLYDGCSVDEIYYCKSVLTGTTKTGSPFLKVVLQDRTGQMDAKIWNPNHPQIGAFSKGDYVRINGLVSTYNNALQISIRSVCKACPGDYTASDYFPTAERNAEEMRGELQDYILSVSDPFLHQLLESFFGDPSLLERFCAHSAAKEIHHACVGGLLEHTLAVAKMCCFLADGYPVINRDLLLTAALLHDIGKMWELSEFPTNDITDDGALLGHISMGAEMIHDHASRIHGFPKATETALKHCILAHHGKLEWGSPKIPSIVEAMALHYADLVDSRLQIATEAFAAAPSDAVEIGYSKATDGKLRRTIL